MPDSLHLWSFNHKTGNPTKSKEVKYLIDKVELAEVHEEGSECTAHHPMTEGKF